MLTIPASTSAGSLCSPQHSTSKHNPPTPLTSSSPSQQRKSLHEDHCSTSALSSTLVFAFAPAFITGNENALRDSSYSEHPTEAAVANNTSDLTQHLPFIAGISAQTTPGVHNTRSQNTPASFNMNSAVNGGNTLGSFFGNSGALSSPSCSRIGLRSTSTSTLLSFNNSAIATEAEVVVSADGNLSIQRQQLVHQLLVHQQNLTHFSGSIADNYTNPGLTFQPILSLLAVASLPSNNSGIEIPRDQVAALSPSCINYDLPSPTYTGLRPSNGSSADRKEGNIDESFTASHAGSHDLAHGFDQCLPKDEESVAGVQVSVSQPLLETPQPDEHDCKIATPLLDLQEQGYAMVSPGKTIVPREFEERLAVITENLMLISLKGVAPVVDECSSSPLDARYLERSSSDQDMPVEGLADQGSLESDGQDEIYLTWLLQRGAVEMEDMALTKAEEVVPASYVISTYELLGQCPFIAKDVPLVPEIRPLGHVQVSKQVRFDPYIHFIMSSLVREDEDLASASSEGPCNSLITDFGQDIASPPSLPDSPVQKSSPFFVDAEFHHLLPALPLTPTLESVLSAFATVEFFSPSHFDEVDLSTLPPLPSSPEVDFINTFTSQVPSEPPTTQDSNTDTDCQPQPSSSNHHNPRVMPLQLNTTLRQHLSDKSANSRSWTMLKSPVSTIRHASSSPLTPASPRTIELAATRQQLQYWTQTATKLRDQERMLTTRIDTLITEMAELIDRCETSEMGLQATEDELQELQRKLVEVRAKKKKKS